MTSPVPVLLDASAVIEGLVGAAGASFIEPLLDSDARICAVNLGGRTGRSSTCRSTSSIARAKASVKCTSEWSDSEGTAVSDTIHYNR